MRSGSRGTGDQGVELGGQRWFRLGIAWDEVVIRLHRRILGSGINGDVVGGWPRVGWGVRSAGDGWRCGGVGGRLRLVVL